MNYNANETGKRLRELRKGKGLTQAGLAEQLHISLRHLQKLESGERSGSIETLAELSFFFQVSLDYLVLGKERNVEMQSRLLEMAHCLEKMAAAL